MQLIQGLNLINSCFQFAYENTETRICSQSIASVVYLETLNEYLYNSHDKALYEAMSQEYQTLLKFLTEQGRYITRNYGDGKWNSWSYEIMPISKYNHDLRHKHGYFKPLHNPGHFLGKSLLLVTYKKSDKMVFDLERSKVKQEAVMAAQRKLGVQNQAISADEFIKQFEQANRDEDLTRRRSTAFDKTKSALVGLFPGIPLRVKIYGSTKSGSCNYGTDLNICIRVSNDYLISNATKLRLKETPFDMNYIASHLKKSDLKSIKTRKTFHHQLNVIEFFDSEGRIPCTLLFDYSLALESSLLVQEYVKLDKRVGPFIYAVKWFVKSQGITFEHEGYLCSYAYTIMALYFLMVVLENPVIPNLQSFQDSCYTYNCSWHSDNIGIVLSNTENPNEVDTSFHDCVYIDNSATDKYVTNKPRTGTVWYSQNKTHLVALLTLFFTYFSDDQNFKNISIVNYIKKISSNACVVICDPFLEELNIGETCFQSSLDYIIYKFNRASIMLREGSSFHQVCHPH
ncbi:hypothetical protein EDC94DRAFT_614480 [Helicostylum pulchrum]|nr:hypothetical protein EDC94DRAFT_614480 [Helicostylum pulchrum]